MGDASKAHALATGMKGMDTSKVAVDDDQEAPTIAAGSAEEKAALEVMEALLPEGSESKAVSTEMKLMCLRGRKYEADRAAALVPDLLALIDELELRTPSEQLKADLESGKVVATGAKDEQGRAIVWIRFRLHDPKKCGPRDFARLIATIMLHLLKDENTARCGVAIMQDATGLGLKNIDPKTAKFVFGSVFPRLPIRVGRLCLFNPPWFIGKIVFPIVKTLMSPKLRSRIVNVNGSDPAPLTEFFPLASLTPEHGGTFAFDLASWAASVKPAV